MLGICCYFNPDCQQVSFSVCFLKLKVWAQTMALVWINACWRCWREREEVKRRTRGRLWLKSARSDFLLVYWFFRPLLFSIARSLARSCPPSQIQMSLVPAEHRHGLFSSLISSFLSYALYSKTLRFLPGALNKEYTVTGEEKEEKERAGVTRYQWNQIYLTCPWATFVFQVDVKKKNCWTDYVECSGSEM